MVERFVPGRELTCGVIGDAATDIIDIVPAEGLEFYDYEAKYAPGGSRHILPAQIPAHVRDAVRAHTLAAHQALGCRGISRCDFRWDDETRRAGLPRDQHPARHDADLAHPRACRPRRHCRSASCSPGSSTTRASTESWIGECIGPHRGVIEGDRPLIGLFTLN